MGYSRVLENQIVVSISIDTEEILLKGLHIRITDLHIFLINVSKFVSILCAADLSV